MDNSLSSSIEGKFYENELMSRHTTWRIGGPADLFFKPANTKELFQALALAIKREIPLTIIGGGSNLLVDDHGLRGMVIQTTGLNQIELFEQTVKVQSGVSLPALTIRSAKAGLSGLEFAAGIPGTIGGAVIMNAGAHGSCLGELVQDVTIIDKQGQLKKLTKGNLGFGYRKSILQEMSVIILEIQLKLIEKEKEKILSTINEYKKLRIQHQPYQYPTAGSIFKNPPGYSAGQLIDQVGAKGWQVGQAQVSNKHANFIINLGGASSSDVQMLILKIQQKVKEKHGIMLEPEIIFLGG